MNGGNRMTTGYFVKPKPPNAAKCVGITSQGSVDGVKDATEESTRDAILNSARMKTC